MVRPPVPGDASFELYEQETKAIHASLERRSIRLQQTLTTLTGVSCAPAQGAMYLFPQITFSQKAHEKAKAMGKQPDEMYALALLEATGIVSFLMFSFFEKKF